MTDVLLNPLSAAENIFYDLVWMPMIRAGESAIEGYVPFLNIPILKQIDEAIILEITDSIFSNLVLMIDVETIKLVNDAHQDAYRTSSIKLMVLAEDKGIDSDEFKAARNAEIAVMSRFTRIQH